MNPREKIALLLGQKADPAAGLPMAPMAVNRPMAASDNTQPIYSVGGEGATGTRTGGKGYGEMTPTEFNREGERRANAGWFERNLPGIIAGAIVPGGGLLAHGVQALDNSAFKDEQAARSADFIGRGQMSPDDFMAGGSSLSGGEGVAGANSGGGEYGGLGGMRDGGFAGGGTVGPEDLMALPVIHHELSSQWDNGDALDPDENAEGMRWSNGYQGGGFVTRAGLSGPDPAGPDQGFAALEAGEVVLNKDQQKKIGRDRIAKALRGK